MYPHVPGGSLFLYRNERQDADGTSLYWPGGPTGLPYRGEEPGLLKQEEFDSLPVAAIVRVRTFYSDTAEDMTDYCSIRGRELNGFFVIRERLVRWDDQRNCHAIFLEWAELAHERSQQIPGLYTHLEKNLYDGTS